MIASMLAACNNSPVKETTGTNQQQSSTPKEDDTVPPPDFDFMANDLTPYITLGEYKGFSFEVDPIEYMDDEKFMRHLNYEIIYYGQYTKVTDRAVTEDDVISIKFEGYLDGEKFNGGSGTEDLFTMYDGGGFIEGFSDAIIGQMPGVEFSFDIKFPDDYGAEELAGKNATFKVTVNFIYQPAEITDELIQEMSNGEMQTAEEFIEEVRKIMIQDTDYAYLYMKRQDQLQVP